MKIRVLIGLLSLSLVFSCQNKTEENKKDTEATVTPEQQIFNVEMDVKAETADDFALYYTQDNSIDFSDKQVIWRGVKGGMATERITFNLPENVLPTNIRIDFGIKKDSKDVTLERFKIEYLNKTIEVKGSEFLYYFMVNDKVQALPDPEKGTITFKKKTEFPAETYYYYPSPALNDTIKVLTMGKK
ncbi:MAG: hypothetical protein ABIQ27_12720 [Flavobacterium sp.]|uniref:hypothetical protein n=1 Tax=Flavobacterium sp. TaxID=239 RepID=UPI003263E95A